MNPISFLIFLLWLACSYLVIRFVLRTGGTTRIGRVAHWFGGAFTILGLAVGMVWIFAQVNGSFGSHANVYLLTHRLGPSKTTQLIQRHASDNLVTVYRLGSVNTAAQLETGQVLIDESKTTHTSLWWMLWDTKYSAESTK